MRLYEIAAILHPELDGAPLTELTEKIEGWITQGSGEIVQTDHWGKRRMAYEINKLREGHYMFWYADLDGTTIDDIERRMGYDEQIIRFLTIRRDALPEGSSRPASDDDEVAEEATEGAAEGAAAADAKPEAAAEAAAPAVEAPAAPAPAVEAAAETAAVAETAAADTADADAAAKAAADAEAAAAEAKAAADAAAAAEAKAAADAAAAAEATAAAEASAATAAVADAAPAAPAADDAEDDLTKLEGVGPKIGELLKMDGIKTFQAVADAGADRLKEVLASAGSRYRMHDPSTWPDQAKLAAAGEWDALKALQDDLKGGRRD